MDPNQSNNVEPNDGGKKKKNKKIVKSDQQQQKDVKSDQQQQKDVKSDKQQQKDVKSDKQQQKDVKSDKQQPKIQGPSTIGKDDLKQMPKNIVSQKKAKQQSQKQDQPNQKTLAKASENSQKQSKVGTTPSTDPPSLSQGNQQIEQEIQIFKTTLAIPKRKNKKIGGTVGRSTEIDVNHLPLNIDKLYEKTVYHINVEFKPELPKRLLRLALEEFNRKNYPNVNVAFDGRRNMYSTTELKGKSGTVSIMNDDNNKLMDFNIVTSVVNIISMNKIREYLNCGSSSNPPGDALQALDIVLKNRPFSLRFTNVGRSFYPVPRITPVDLGEGMELWKGFFQSPVMGWKPYLNIDVAHKGFPKHQPLVSYIENELRCNLTVEMDQRSSKSLLAYVKGLKIDFMIPQQPNTKRTYKVVGLLETAKNFKFEMDIENGKGKKTLNVVQYFQSVKNYTIKYPNLPCLHVGNVNKRTAIPIELCAVVKGQIRLKKLTENQTACMVKHAARPPAERRQTIESCIKDINYNKDPVLKEFGIDITEKFATIPARVLDQPSLAYAQNKETKPKLGVWRPDRFSRAIQLKRWIIMNMDQRTNVQNLKMFEKSLIESGRGLNVIVNPMDPVFTYQMPRGVSMSKIKDDITTFFNQQKNIVELIVVIIPDFPAGIYATVKQASELQVGVLTQCIKSKTIYKMNNTTASNILLKINSKLNGVNHTLAVRSSPHFMEGAIIFGADVTHPSPEQSNIPSVAAVAASHDLYGSQYNMEWRLQDPKVEIIHDLEDIVHKQLLKFKERTKTIPKKIFYFRDGVSEGMFLQLLEYELVSIRRACLRLNIKYRPSVTFLVVQKRHHTRMFPKHSIDMDGKYSNVCSGTIIDTQITHPTEIDFYLCSHASIQGTSRPTKYHLIWDDNNFTENELEQLTFYLCFLFVRCTRSVSYPAPTYYAHLAAFRARAYIENKTINLNRLDEEQDNMVKNGFNGFTVNTPMFFV